MKCCLNEEYATGSIVVNQREGTLPDDILLRFNITKTPIFNDGPPIEETNDHIAPTYDYLYKNLEVELVKQMNEEITELSLNQSIEVYGMQIKFSKLFLTPTTMNLEMDIEPDTMNFYEFKSIRLKSEDKTYSKITNGVTRSGDMDNGFIYYFETNLFDTNESLDLIIDGIYALPKSNSSIFIDISKNKIVHSLNAKLTFNGVEDTGKYYKFRFTGGDGQQVQFKSCNGESIFNEQIGYFENSTD